MYNCSPTHHRQSRDGLHSSHKYIAKWPRTKYFNLGGRAREESWMCNRCMVRRLRPTRVVVRFRVRSFAVLWVCIVLRSATHTFCSSLTSISDSPINFARYSSQVPPYHPGKVSEHVWIIIIQFFAFYLCALFIGSLVRGRGLDAMFRVRADPRDEDVSRVTTFDSIILTFSVKVKLDWCTTSTGSSSSQVSTNGLNWLVGKWAIVQRLLT